MAWTLVKHEGFVPPPRQPLDQEASREACWEIFHWFVVNGEGIPPEDIYKDEWLAELNDDESVDEDDHANESVDSDTTRRKKHSGLETWLDTIT